MNASRRRCLAVGLEGLAGGILAALSLPPFGLWILGVVGVAVVYVLLQSAGTRLRFLAGAGFGIGFFGIGYFWITGLVWAGWPALVVLEAALSAIACVAVGAHRPSKWGVLAPLTFAGLLVMADALRWWWPFGGMPIGSIALGQAAGPLGQLARVGGPLLVEGAVFLLAGCLGEIALRSSGLWHHEHRRSDNGNTVRTDHGSPPAERQVLTGASLRMYHALSPLYVIGAVGVLLAVASFVAPDGGRPVGSLRVAAVQGGGVRGLHAIFTDATVVYDKQLRPTLMIPKRPHIDLVVWPEDVIALPGPLAGSTEQAAVAGAAHRLSATLVAGVTETVGTSSFRNEVVAWAPDGSVIGRYEKVHRVPFGEYIPFRSLFSHFGPTNLVPRDAIPGRGPGILATPAARLGLMISFEVFFPERARMAVTAGATVLVVPTNDASYSTGQVPAQEVAADRLRAIEEGRDLVQAAPTGYTGFVDRRGDLLLRSALGAQEVLEAPVSLYQGRTWYSYVGDWPVIVACILLVGIRWVVQGREDPLTVWSARGVRPVLFAGSPPDDSDEVLL